MIGTVLLVDDSPQVRALFGHVLRRNHFDVCTAADGQEAMRRLTENVVSCVVLDIVMPDAGGATFLLHMRNAGFDVPAVVITGGVDPTQDVFARFCATFGVTKVLAKPFSETQIVNAVHAAIG